MSEILIGIDEAGRGPLAGPVSVGVFVVKDRKVLKKFRGVKDSKQLSEKQREEWYKRIKDETRLGRQKIFYAVSFCSAKKIDEKGISWAIRTALSRALKRLEKLGKNAGISTTSRILLDGSLRAPARFTNQLTIIDGDAKEPIIALASICAKVFRDRKMCRFSKIYPNCGFHIHKGYGTKKHYEAIKKHGITPIHRRSFLKNIAID